MSHFYFIIAGSQNSKNMSSNQTNADGRNVNTENGGNQTHTYTILQQSQKIRKNIQNISQLLNTGLSTETLDICIKLCEAGVHPQALADVINAVQQEMEELNRENF